jgi:arginyl-tRNA synthetase
MVFEAAKAVNLVDDKTELVHVPFGLVQGEDGKKFKKEFRTIRLEDQKMQINNVTKQPEVLRAKGTTFFEARPEFFMPTHGGYDIRYKATSSTPISKP